MLPKIIEPILNEKFNALSFVFICFKYILFIPMPVTPIIIKPTPIKQIRAMIIPIIAAKNGKKIIKSH
ncbi:hypothetical protein DFR90_005303 [Clostridium beijerinckii]|nr:hypothetical protein [Clostridium beijerinckii]